MYFYKNIFRMKNLKFIVLLFVSVIVISCSDTNVTLGKVDETVGAAPISGQFQKRVLIEDYTGAWCGNCARVAFAVDTVFTIPNNKAVTIAIHSGANNPSNLNTYDPYNFADIAPLKNLILPTSSSLALPQARLNRTIIWTYPEPKNIPQVKNLTSNNCGLGLAMNSTVSGGNINLDVNVKFVQNYTNIKLVVYVLESHLIFRQANYTNHFGAINPILNYENNHVLRTSLTNVLGDPFTGNTVFGQTITKNFSLAVPSNIANAANLNFVAFVVDANNNVVNVRASDANENQIFEQNP
jgi:Outer membrane protein Omp28